MTEKSKMRPLGPVLVLVVITFFVFWPVRLNDFVDYDDLDYVVKNGHIQSGLTFESVRWAFTSGYAANWHPLTWLSHMIDVELFGLNPYWHHLHSVAIHMLNAVLLFLILQNVFCSKWISFFIAAVFSLHPLRVESVAWVSERKDVLCAFFFMLTLAAYLYYVRKKAAWPYLLVILFFALGLMAKPMLVTLPLILLVLDWWPLNRWDKNTFSNGSLIKPEYQSLQKHPAKYLIIEKVPLFVLVLVSCIVTFLVQQRAGSVGTATVSLRVVNAFNSYIAYLSKIFCPVDLAVLYPYPSSVNFAKFAISILVLIAWSAIAFHYKQKRPYLLAGWLWYVIMLLPVIGLVQVGLQSMADRYTYLPSIGITIMLACAAAQLTAHWKFQKAGAVAATALTVITLTLCTRAQTAYWQNSLALHTRAVAVTSGNFMAQHNLGQVLLQQKRYPEAAEHIRASLRINPDYPVSNANMALVCIIENRPDDALKYVNKALAANHNRPKVYYDCGLILERLNRPHEALAAFEKAVQLQPDYKAALERIRAIKQEETQ